MKLTEPCCWSTQQSPVESFWQAPQPQFGSPSTPRTQTYRAGSPAARSPAPAALRPEMRFTPPKQYLSVLLRPANLPMSMKNAEMLDAQFELDKMAAERHANTFRTQVHERWHHNGPPSKTLLEAGHIVDRGRGKGVQAQQGSFDPILSQYRISPLPCDDSAHGKQQRPSSAPAQERPGTPSRMDKVLQETRGVRNPITGEYKPGCEPSPEYEARKTLEWQRTHGHGRGMVSRADKDWSFNPITGEAQAVSPNAKVSSSPQRPQSAPRGAWSANVTSPGHPSTPSKRPISSGDTWGVYNPINHVWTLPPADTKFQDSEKVHERLHGISGSRSGKVSRSPNQGVYNPILNVWTILPANSRIAAGLGFAPATLFSRPAAHTIRS